MRNDNAYASVQRAAQFQRIAVVLHVGACHCALESCVRNDRQVEPRGRRIEPVAQRRAGIDPHRRRKPFDPARAAALRSLQCFNAIAPVGVHRGHPLENPRIARGRIAHIRVRHVEPGVVPLHLAVRAESALEREQQDLCAWDESRHQVFQALDVGLVYAGRLVGASGIEEEDPARVLGRVEQALHARIDPDAARRIPGAHEVRVRIPHARGIDAFPRGLDEFMVRKPPRQVCEAWVPQPLLGPEAPRGQRSRTSRHGATRQEEAAPVQLRDGAFRQANS